MAEPAIVCGRMKIFLTFLALAAFAAFPAFAADPVVCGSTAEAQLRGGGSGALRQVTAPRGD